MERHPLSPRARLALAYELAFYPPRLHKFWHDMKTGALPDREEAADLIDMALALHQRLPEQGYASQRALNRLALRQAKARAFGTVQFLRNLRARLGREEPLAVEEVPPWMVRDIGLPPLCHKPRENTG